MAKKVLKRKKPREFYILVRKSAALEVNWGCYGFEGVYAGSRYTPRKGDQLVRVQEAGFIRVTKVSQQKGDLTK